MPKAQSVVSLDPIDRQNKRRSGPIGRLFKSKRFKGKPMSKTDPFGLYLMTGKQRSGKTASGLFLLEYLKKKYEKKGKNVVIYSNMGFGIPVHLTTFSNQINACNYNPDNIYIFMIDEIQSWFPKDTKNTTLLMFIDQLTGQFSQLGKRQIYVIATAQVYGRVNKNLREQCLYMVYCRPSAFRNKCVNEQEYQNPY